MSFFDLIEKEEVFLNEYLLFQKNRKYDKYIDEIKRFFKVKKVTSRKTFYTQPHDVTFLQNTFIDLDSRKDKKYYYFMYNSDWSPNQQKMLLHNSQHISKYFCLNDEICQRLIDLTTCANIFSLKGDLNMLKYISKLEENGITYSQQNLDDYFEAFIQQSFDVYTPVKYIQTLTSIPPTVCKQVVILYVLETKSLTKSETNIQLQSFLQQKNVVLWFTPFQNVFKLLNSLEISNKAVLLLSSGMEVLSNGVDKMFRMLNSEPELKYVNSYFKDDFKWYSHGHEYGFLNLYYNYTPPFMMVKIEDGNIPVFKHNDFKVSIWEYSISLANQGKCGYTMSECLVKCPGNMFPEGNRMHSLITKIRKKYPKVYTDPLEYPFVDRQYSNGEIITDKYKNCEYEPDYRHYGLTRRDFILQMLENIKPPFSHPKNKKSENNNVVNKRYMDETMHDKIFVTLPTFNRGEKCIQVIQNIIDQKYTDWKLYVIDDGSEKIHGDKIKQFIEKCDKKYDIEYVRNDVNLKLPKTLNVSIQQFLKSDCDYFTWVSDDNEYYHNFLEDLHCEISKENVDLVYSGWDENIEGTSEIRYKNPTYNCFEDVLNKWDGMASFMWTKQMISQIGEYNFELNSCEDYDYMLRTFQWLDKASYVNTSTMKYTVNSEGSTSLNTELCEQVKYSIKEFYHNVFSSKIELSNFVKCIVYFKEEDLTLHKNQLNIFLTDRDDFEISENVWKIPKSFQNFIYTLFKIKPQENCLKYEKNISNNQKVLKQKINSFENIINSIRKNNFKFNDQSYLDMINFDWDLKLKYLNFNYNNCIYLTLNKNIFTKFYNKKKDIYIKILQSICNVKLYNLGDYIPKNFIFKHPEFDIETIFIYDEITYNHMLWKYINSDNENKIKILNFLTESKYIIITSEIFKNETLKTIGMNDFSRYFSLYFFKNAENIIICNYTNIYYLVKNNILIDKIIYFPAISYSKLCNNVPLIQNKEKDVDVLFYGNLTHTSIQEFGWYQYRYHNILKRLQKLNKYNVIIKAPHTKYGELFDEEKNKLLKQTKIVIHIPSFSNLNTFPWAKVTELMYKKIFFIIEESEELYYSKLHNTCAFYKRSDFDDLIEKIDFYLNNDIEKNKIINNCYDLVISKFNLDKLFKIT